MTVSGQILQSHQYSDKYNQPQLSRSRVTESNRIYGGYYRASYHACNPKLGYCRNPRCWRPDCRKRYRQSANDQILAMAFQAQLQGHLLRFITLKPLNTQQPTHHLEVIKNLKESVQELNKRLMERLSRRGHSAMACRVWGMKQKSTPHQLHAHLLVTFTSDCDPLAEASWMTWLKSTAEKKGLRVHVEDVSDAVGVANYMAHKNLKELEEIDLPPNFQRFRASNNAPKMPWQEQKARRRKIRVLRKQRKAQLRQLLQHLRKDFPILYWGIRRKWLLNNLNRHMNLHSVQQTSDTSFQGFKRLAKALVPLGRWFTRRLSNLSRKARYEMRWLTRQQELQQERQTERRG